MRRVVAVVCVALAAAAAPGGARHDAQLVRGPLGQPGPEAPADVATACVLIERVEEDGQTRAVNGFVLEGGVVVTALHCLAGIEGAFVNFGAAGLSPALDVVLSDECNDLVAFRAEVPPGVKGLVATATRPATGAPLMLVTRDPYGVLTTRMGVMSKVMPREDMMSLETTIPAWLGTSGSAVVDTSGRLVGVVTRLCGTGEGRAALTPAFRIAKFDWPGTPLREWIDGQRASTTPRVDELRRRGEQYQAAGQVDGARAAFTSALALDPNDARSIYGSVTCLDNFTDEAAAAWLGQYTALHPAARSAWACLGHCRFRQGRYAEARESYAKALSIRDTVPLRYWHASASAAMNDGAAMARDVQVMLDEDPAFEPAIELWASRCEWGRDLTTLRRLRKAMWDLCPEDPQRVAEYADVLQKLGRLDELGPLAAVIREKLPFVSNEIRLREELVSRKEPPARGPEGAAAAGAKESAADSPVVRPPQPP